MSKHQTNFSTDTYPDIESKLRSLKSSEGDVTSGAELESQGIGRQKKGSQLLSGNFVPLTIPDKECNLKFACNAVHVQLSGLRATQDEGYISN